MNSNHQNSLSCSAYYILTTSCRYTGREREAGIYLEEMKKEYPQSELTGDAGM